MLDREPLAAVHPVTQAPELNWVGEPVPLFGTGTLVGSGLESTSSQDDDGAAAAKDAARAERKREASMALGLKEKGEGMVMKESKT